MTSQGIPPQMNYKRKWPVSPNDDPVPHFNEHAMIGLLSALVTQYTYKVELHGQDDSLIETVIHSTYKRVAPFDDADQFRRGLGVNVKLPR
jgi:hypothetical protein